MKTVNEIKVLLQRSAVVIAVFAVTSTAFSKAAQAGDDTPSEHRRLASSIYAEVVKECHHKDSMEVFFFVVAHRMGQSVPTAEQEAKYLADDKNFAKAQARSKCWTRDRWTRYVKAEIADQRYKDARFKAQVEAKNGIK